MKKDVGINTGRIILAEKYPTPVAPGNLIVHAKQELSGDEKLKSAVIQEEEFLFTCEAAGLTLGEEEIYSTYPPKDSFGLFETVLPHMVLRKKTLPWERDMGIDGAPWIALLLFSEEEPVKLQSMDVAKAFRVEGDTYCPVTAKEGYELGTNVLVLDVASELFGSVCPLAKDLPLLAHVRQVNRDNKATEEIFQGEWLSVLTCNRLPCSGTGKKGLRNTVYLVSLEDFGTFLLDDGVREQICSSGKWKKVRIPVLTSFSFYSKKEDYDFAGCFEALEADTLKIRSDKAKDSLSLLQRGYTAHNHFLRDGGVTVSLYHGPFLPWDAPVYEAKYEIFTDARLIYQPELGMFDVSMSTAANLGRMLGLQDKIFAKRLLAFRAENRLVAEERYYHRKILNGVYGIEWKTECTEEQSYKKSLKKDVTELLERLLERQQEEFSSGIKTEVENDGNKQEAGEEKSSFIKEKGTHLHEDYYSFLDMEMDIPEEITNFLARLSLLYQVPFSYLVPDERMLPEDSIRFFRIDVNWLNALLDGAMSLGRCFEEDYVQDTELIETILSRVYEKRSAIRPLLQRKSRQEQDFHVKKCLEDMKNSVNGMVNTGFLLRSELVRGFQGIEFVAYAGKGEKTPLSCLRLQVIGKEILLGIYAGECNYLEIKQPPEGMHFGMEKKDSRYQKRLRSLETGELFSDEEKYIVQIFFRDVERGVVDFEETARQMEEKLGLTKVTSAHFALQMIQNPFTGIVESTL